MTKATYLLYLTSDHWKQFRQQMIFTSGKVCQVCSQRRHIEIHHLNYYCLGKETPQDVIILCRQCHQRVHDKYWKGDLINTKLKVVRTTKDPWELSLGSYKSWQKILGGIERESQAHRVLAQFQALESVPKQYEGQFKSIVYRLKKSCNRLPT